MKVIEWLGSFGQKVAEWFHITGWFQNNEAYKAFGMAIFLVCFFIFFGWLIYKKTRKTRSALSMFALEMGYSFEPKDKGLMTADFFQFPLFRRGSSRGIKNVLKGQFEGVKFTLFEYWYRDSEGSPNYYMVVAFPMDKGILPDFEFRNESITDKIRERFGYKDIDFEFDPEFSKRYLLRGSDERAVRELFHEDIRSFFNIPKKRKLGGVEGGGQWLVYYQSTVDYMGRAIEKYIQDIRGCLDDAYEVFIAFQQ